MTATLSEPEIPHVCVFMGLFGEGYTCVYGYSMAWSMCPLEAVAECLAAESNTNGGMT